MSRILTILFITICARGAVLQQSIRFGPEEFDWAERDGYAVVLGRGMESTGELGAPALPLAPVAIALPGRCRVTQVTVTAGAWESLRSEVIVQPAQPPRVLADTSPTDGAIAADPKYYRAGETYPALAGRWTGTSRRGESTLVQTLVCPLRTTRGTVELCREFVVSIEYEPAGAAGLPAGTGPEYVIVTGAGLDTVFARLAAWKTQKGVPAAVRDIAAIVGRYPGRDDAERLREYLKTLPDSGTRWVLLGGDVDIVPFRKAFAMNCDWGAHPREDSLPCDLYFADLDGNWDANGNGTFGEVDDSVDLLPDIIVGRAPVNDVAQAQAFVEKTLDYEHAAGTGAETKGLFFAEVLWDDPYTDMGRHKDRIDTESFGPGFELARLYQSRGNETREAVMQAMRDGQNFINHDGHGWTDVMSCGGRWERLRTADAETLTTAYAGVLYSIGCWTTAFDTVSIGEAFVQNPNGGAVAVIGNSSYGWGSPGNPGFGISDKFDSRFWHAALREGRPRLGLALAAAKEQYAPLSHDRNVYRWHQYCLNLMGDPELAIWTGTPRVVSVSAPEAIGLGPARVTVAVTSAGAPVESALVCLAKPGESYSRAITDRNGNAALDASAVTPGGFALTVTAAGCFPVEMAVPCVDGPVVLVVGFAADDRAGNGDGIPNPGERLSLDVVFANTGNLKSGEINAVLRTADQRVTVFDSVAVTGELGGIDTIALPGAFSIELGGTFTDGEVVRFEVLVRHGWHQFASHPSLVVGSGAARVERWWLEPVLVPGGSAEVGLRLANHGHGFARSVWCRLLSLDADVTVTAESVWCGDISPLGAVVPAGRFGVAVGNGAVSGRAADALLETFGDGASRRETLRLAIGATGFVDDVETGDGGWTHSGLHDNWHRSRRRAHSGEWAWYAGDSVAGEYPNGADAALVSGPILAPAACTLSFRRWFRVPNYGVDGVRVILVRAADEETLDFIGSGGALGPAAGIESGWAEERYDLGSLVAAGEVFRLKFAFVSDRDTADEGVYLDDIRVSGGESPLNPAAPAVPGPAQAPALSALPRLTRGTVRFRVGPGAPVGPLRIFDARGVPVRELVVAAGVTDWDGRDRHGRRVSAGLYVAEVREGSTRRHARVVVLR